MILYAFRRWLLAAVISLLAMTGAQANQFTVVRDGDTLIVLERNLVVAKYNETTGEAVGYAYLSGFLWRAAYSDGTVITYVYDAQGRLLRIDTNKYVRDRQGQMTPTSVAGTTQQAIYEGDRLVALVSSTGARLAIDPKLAQPGDVVMQVKAARGRAAKLSAPTAGDKKKSFNHRMMAIHGWETRPAEWECSKTPEGEDICIGRGPGGGGGGPAPPYEPGPQPDKPPPGHGGGGGDEGIGGGGGDDGYVYVGSVHEIPPNLPTRASCMVAAINTYWIMIRQFCPYVRDPGSCQAQAFTIFEEQKQDCIRLFPPD